MCGDIIIDSNAIRGILASKGEALLPYSPYSFLRAVERSRLIAETVIDPLVKLFEQRNTHVVHIRVKNRNHVFFIRKKQWDTDYFKFPIYNIEYILYDHADVSTLNKAIEIFVRQEANIKEAYYAIDIPVEDICLLQAISSSKFTIIEPRNHYHLPNVQDIITPEYHTRLANDSDIKSLKDVARKCRNIYDRVHADPAFDEATADEYIATYVENSVKGFADFTLIPDVSNQDPFGFLASNKPIKICDSYISKFVLAAVDNSVQKGWYYKLNVAQINLLKREGADYLTTTTQASNRGSIHTWEKLGFKQHATSIVFSFKND